MKRLLILSLLTGAFLTFGGGLNEKSQAASAPDAPTTMPTPVSRTKAKTPKAQTKESLPEKIDNETAVSPVYKINSKNCANHDDEASEGMSFVRRCKGYGNYFLSASGSDYRVNYGIESSNKSKNFSVMLFPLETGEAAKYVRADLYDEKLGDKIEWRLDAQGKPFAIIVRASFYKNTGSAKTFSNPKNKVTEFVFVRGLAGYENLKEDLRTVNTPYNTDEQARMIAAEYLEKHRK